ncbi:pancreatic secretory granule membrane major glycoprotein GP2-like [Discoglossus pictus]
MCEYSCTSGKGCRCSDEKICLPNKCTLDASECCPTGYSWDSINSCCTAAVIGSPDCIPPCLSDEICEKDATSATCVCDPSVYKNMTIKDLKPTVTCDGSTTTVSVSKCLLDYLHYDYTTIRLKNDPNKTCSDNYTLNNQGVQSLLVKATCGNRVTSDLSKVNYTNTLYIDIKHDAVIVVNPIEMDFTCSYNRTMQTSLNVTLHPVASTTFLNATNGEGSYPLTLAAYKNSEYNIPFTDGENVDVGSPIYLGLFTTGADGDKFVLRVVNCYSTPSSSDDDPRVQLLSGGCPIDGGDVDAVIGQNGVSLEARFRVNAFAFDGFPTVSIFCEARLCEKTNGNCSLCNNGRTNEPNTGDVSVTLAMNERLDLSSSGTHAVSSPVVAGSLLLLLFNKLY